MLVRPRFRAAVAAVCLFWVGTSTHADALQTYLAVGDSLAFGETDFTHNPSSGDRGYVGLYANSLAAANGGVRPNVINLGVDGETSTTFFQGGPHGNGTLSGQPAPQLNTNYANPAPTQNGLMLSTIASEQAAGHNISTVSVQLGANDLLAVVNQPNFFSLSPPAQQAAIAHALAAIQTNDTALLAEIKALLPHATILMMGYYNPFNAAPNTPIGHVADPAIQALNTLISAEANAFGAGFVNVYGAFKGKELADTYIASGNVHPNAQGYALIEGQMQQVPEPSTFALVSAGGLVWFLAGRCRRLVLANRAAL
jgi:lysophospholipase L1-like esterase